MQSLVDCAFIDLVLPADAQPNEAALIEALGGAEASAGFAVLDVDHDVPQYETDVSPTLPLRRAGERRLLFVDQASGPLRASPRTEPIVARDLRPDVARLVALVELLGARFGRLGAFASFGDAAIAVRSVRDLRGLMLLGWAYDPTRDLEGRRRATPLTQREFEEKVGSYSRRLDELDDADVIARIAPDRLSRHGEGGKLLVVEVLSDRDGSWDVRKGVELEARLAAVELFARIPGARVSAGAPPAELTPAPVVEATLAPLIEATPAPEVEPVAEIILPPIHAIDLADRTILRLPAERFDLDAVTLLGRRSGDLIRPGDLLTSLQKDRLHHGQTGFIAPLAFLSEVFIDGRPLDRKRFEAEARPFGDDGRTFEAHLPRFGTVHVVAHAGRRWVTSEASLSPEDLATLVAGAH